MAQSEPRLPSLAHGVLRNPNPQRPCKACGEQESRPGQQDRRGSALIQPRPQTRHGQNSLGPSFWTQPGGTTGDEKAPRRTTPPLQEGCRRSQLDGAHLATLFSSPFTHTTHTPTHTRAHTGFTSMRTVTHRTQTQGDICTLTWTHTQENRHMRGPRTHTCAHAGTRRHTWFIYTPYLQRPSALSSKLRSPHLKCQSDQKGRPRNPSS